MISYYEFQMAVKMCAGDGALEHIPYELASLNAKKPLIMTDKGLVKAGALDTLLGAIGGVVDCSAVFDDVPQDSGLDTVEKAAAALRGNGCDALLALGGGSVLDTAKGVVALITQNAQKITDVIGCEEMKRGAVLPFIAVPTTSGTGSEATAVAVIADHENGVKLEFITDKMQPDVAILDARLTEKLPPRLTAATAADALCHAVEAYTCRQKNPVSDAFAAAAIKMICANMQKVIDKPSDKGARLALANASFMAGAAFSNSMVGAVHGIGHALGGVCGVPHGEAMAILLPHVMKFNLSVCADGYADLLLHMAGAERYVSVPASRRGEEAIAFVVSFMKKLNTACGMPVTLEQTGRVKKDDFPAICEKALNDGAMLFNPRQADKDDVIALLTAAF